jgi:hypothetical protein
VQITSRRLGFREIKIAPQSVDQVDQVLRLLMCSLYLSPPTPDLDDTSSLSPFQGENGAGPVTEDRRCVPNTWRGITNANIRTTVGRTGRTRTTCTLPAGVEVIRLCNNYVWMTLSLNQDPGGLPRITPGFGVRSQPDLTFRTEHRTPPSTPSCHQDVVQAKRWAEMGGSEQATEDCRERGILLRSV